MLEWSLENCQHTLPTCWSKLVPSQHLKSELLHHLLGVDTLDEALPWLTLQ